MMPTKAEVDKRTRISELIYVEEYTRSDGTKVSGYIELIPDKLTTKFLKNQNLFYIEIHVLIDCRFYKLILYSS